MQTVQDGSHNPQAIHRVWIPKPGNKEKRPLRIPTMGNRVLQTALRAAETAYCAEGREAVQRADSGIEEPDPRDQYRMDGQGTGPVFTGLDRLIREVRNDLGAAKSWRSGPDADCSRRSGSNGIAEGCCSPSCGSEASIFNSARLRRAARRVCGTLPIARLSRLRCPMFTSTRSGFRD
jgi:hypothetical protein